MIYELLSKSGIAAPGWGGDVVATRNRAGKGNVHTTVKGTATVEIQGRISNSSTWVTIGSSTLTDSTECLHIDIFPQMRAVVTGASGNSYATGSITISDEYDPTQVWSVFGSPTISPILISILPVDAVKADMKFDFWGNPPPSDGTMDEINWIITDGSGNEITFEFDSVIKADACTIDFASGVSAGDTITIYDIGGRGREYIFSTAIGDNTTSLRTEVLVGNGVDDAGTNLEKAMRIDWPRERIALTPYGGSKRSYLSNTLRNMFYP